VKFKISLWMAVQILLGLVQAQTTTSAAPRDQGSAQLFVCNVGYTPEKCQKQTAILRKALAKYPVERLGNWTWVLVRSVDWRDILLPRGLNPDSPAFTYLPKRETFIEEALVTPVAVRRGELLNMWQMSMSDLLDFVIAHELGHAFCNDRDEGKARHVARMLQNGLAISCEARRSAKAD
jgi:hypothetical protein